MKPFSSDGDFWLPANPGRRVCGTLTFDGDLSLVVYDALQEFSLREGTVQVRAGGQWTTEPVVHGRLRDGTRVTLLDVSGMDLSGPFGWVKESHDVRVALTGGSHYVEEDRFERLSCTFDVLAGWAHPDPIWSDQGNEDQREINVLVDRTVLHTAVVDELTVRLVRDVEGGASDAGVHLDAVCLFEVEGPPDSLHSLLAARMRPLQDFLIVCLGRPVRVTGLLVRRPGAGPRERSSEVSIPAVQPADAPSPSAARMRNYDAPTLLLPDRSPVPFAELMPAWFRLREELSEVITLLCGPFYAPFIYDEHRYASIYQSAEALAQARHGGRDKDRLAHRARLADAVAALRAAGLPEETVTWATNVLQARNDKPLAAQIEDLVRSTGAVGQDILVASPDFPQAVTKLRVGVSHGGAGSSSAGTPRRYWHGQVLLWVLRTRLLAALGLPLEGLAAEVQKKPGFQRALREVRKTDG